MEAVRFTDMVRPGNGARSHVDDLLMKPLAAEVAPDKGGGPNDPVQTHGQPDAGQLHAHVVNEEVAQADADSPHGDDGNHHGEAGIARGPKGVGQRKA